MKLLLKGVNIKPWGIITKGEMELGVIAELIDYDEEDIIDQLLQHLSKEKIIEIIDKLERK